jgi:TonB family protein
MSTSTSGALRLAEEYAVSGKLEGAIGIYRRVVETEPSNVVVKSRLGELYVLAKQAPAAVKIFSELASVFTASGKVPEATATLKRVLQIDPLNADAIVGLGNICARSGLAAEAERLYVQAAEIYSRNQDDGKLQLVYKSAVAIAPDNPELQLKFGALCHRSGRLNSGYLAFMKAASEFTKQGNQGAALNAYGKALKIAPSSDEATNAAAEMMNHLNLTEGRNGEAPRGTGAPGGTQGKGANRGAAVTTKMESRSQAEIERLITPTGGPEQIEQNGGGARGPQAAAMTETVPKTARLGAARTGTDTMAKAADHSAKVDSEGVQDEGLVAAISKAEILFGFGRFDVAIAILEQLLEVRPDDVRVYNKLKDIYLRSEMPEKAAEVYLDLARIYKANGENERAANSLASARRLGNVPPEHSDGVGSGSPGARPRPTRVVSQPKMPASTEPGLPFPPSQTVAASPANSRASAAPAVSHHPGIGEGVHEPVRAPSAQVQETKATSREEITAPPISHSRAARDHEPESTPVSSATVKLPDDGMIADPALEKISTPTSSSPSVVLPEEALGVSPHSGKAATPKIDLGLPSGKPPSDESTAGVAQVSPEVEPKTNMTASRSAPPRAPTHRESGALAAGNGAASVIPMMPVQHGIVEAKADPKINLVPEKAEAKSTLLGVSMGPNAEAKPAKISRRAFWAAAAAVVFLGGGAGGYFFMHSRHADVSSVQVAEVVRADSSQVGIADASQASEVIEATTDAQPIVTERSSDTAAQQQSQQEVQQKKKETEDQQARQSQQSLAEADRAAQPQYALSPSGSPAQQPQPTKEAPPTVNAIGALPGNASRGANLASSGVTGVPRDIPLPPPPAAKTPAPVKSTGIIYGATIRQVQPVYPQVARATHATGSVSVQMSIDESGNVVSVHAVSGPGILVAAAESAARGFKFKPTSLDGKAIKTTKTITFNFKE